MIHYAAACAGILLNALNFRLSAVDLAYIVNHVRARVIFVDALLLSEFEKVSMDSIPHVHTVIVCGANEAPGGWRSKLPSTVTVVDFDAFLSRGSNDYRWPSLDERSAVGVCFTSGTTGKPKGVIFSHRSCFVHVLALMMTDFLSVSGTDVWLPLAPMFHAGAWCIPYLALCVGTKIVLSNQYSDPKVQMQMMTDHKVTIFSGVPTVMQSLRMEYESDPAKYNGIKRTLSRVLTGGSMPPLELLDWYRKTLDADVTQIWGMTEMNPFGTFARRVSRQRDLSLNEEQLTRNQTVCGVPIPSVEMKVVDPDNFDRELPWDGKSVGDLIVRGVSTCDSYFNVSEEVMRKKFFKGWLITGDLAARTESGQLVIKDRSKDMIKSGGEWISSVDLAIPIALADNAGLSPIETVATAKKQQLETKNHFLGIDCMVTGVYDMKKQGVYETLRGKQQAYLLATQVVKMILKIHIHNK